MMPPMVLREIADALVSRYSDDVDVMVGAETKDSPALLDATYKMDRRQKLTIYRLARGNYAGGIGGKIERIDDLNEIVTRWQNLIDHSHPRRKLASKLED